MAVWHINRDLAVTYARRGEEQNLGQAEHAMLADVESWAACEAKPWDVITSPSGTYGRLPNPSTLA